MNVAPSNAATSGCCHSSLRSPSANAPAAWRMFSVVSVSPLSSAVLALPTNTPYIRTAAPASSGSIVNLCFAVTPVINVNRSPWKSISMPGGRSRKATSTLSSGCICKNECLLFICLPTGAKFENFVHYYPFFAWFSTRYRLLEFPRQLLPSLYMRICSVSGRLISEREIIIRFNNHKHPVAKPENLHLGNTRIRDGLPDFRCNLPVQCFILFNHLGIVLEV